MELLMNRVWKALLAAAVLSSLLAVSAVTPSPAAGSGHGLGGPLVLMGIDAEDGGPNGHGPVSVYVNVVNSIRGQTTNGGSGLLVAGCTAGGSDHVSRFWQAVSSLTGEPLTCMDGAAAITAQNFNGFRMIGVASDQGNTPSGGLTNPENDALSARSADIANFVNNGGGLLGFSSVALNDPYGYLGDVGTFSFTPGGGSNITATPAGSAIGITDALDVCCWHDDYVTFPSFLSVLAHYAGTSRVAAIGGAQVVIPSGITLAPASATLCAGDDHTVTATVEDGDGNPIAGEVVDFVVSGANSAAGQGTTDAAGMTTFTYTGANVGGDTITASFDDEGTIRAATASATFEQCNQPPDCSGAVSSISEIWPPNHRMVAVTVNGVTDPDGDPVTITITSIWQDEPVNTASDGNTAPDGAGVGTSTAEVRAERAGSPEVPGNGRVYHIGFTADDGQGAANSTCSGTVTTGVPHDVRSGYTIVDDGALHDSTLP